MTKSKRTVIRILLFVAKMVAEDEKLEKEIQELANYISAWEFGK